MLTQTTLKLFQLTYSNFYSSREAIPYKEKKISACISKIVWHLLRKKEFTAHIIDSSMYWQK